MARTYTDIPEPRKVLEADTIRGYSRETVEEALAGGAAAASKEVEIPAENYDIVLTDAQVTSLLSGNAVTIDGAYDDFFPALPKYKIFLTMQLGSTGNIMVLYLSETGATELFTTYSATGYVETLSAVKTIKLQIRSSAGEILGILLRVE